MAAAEAAGVTLVPRSQAEIERFFTDLELVDPGVTPVLSWRPDEPVDDPTVAYYWAGSPASPDRRRQRSRSSKSPSLTPPRKASSSASVNTSAGPSGSREFRTATPAPGS